MLIIHDIIIPMIINIEIILATTQQLTSWRNKLSLILPDQRLRLTSRAIPAKTVVEMLRLNCVLEE